jgi:predicted transcriptional regulator
MKTTEPRDHTWEEIRERMAGARAQVWDWLHAHGPATTSTIAAGLGMSLFTVRPRVCELAQMGFAECTGRQGREGIYRACTATEAHERWREGITATQLPLKLEAGDP